MSVAVALLAGVGVVQVLAVRCRRAWLRAALLSLAAAGLYRAAATARRLAGAFLFGLAWACAGRRAR